MNGGFLEDRAKARATAAVKAFEKHTSAELVVTVRKGAGTWREADFAWGAAFGFVTLLFLLFYPRDFAVGSMPLDVLVAFAIGFFASRMIPALRRLATTAASRRAAVDLHAKAAFVDLGVTRTTGRTGMLVYVALFERAVGIVTDAGVSEEAKAAALAARDALEAAVSAGDIEPFAAALEALGPAFGKTMPRAADDVNELPDEVA
jgi:putative membrane protein